MPEIFLRDFQCHYESIGQKNAPIVIFSNSLGTNTKLWQKQVLYFSPHCRILLYDHRGHGKSSTGKFACTIDTFAEDVIALMDELSIDCAHWVGLSIGGMIGQNLAARYPKRFDRLVFACTSSDQSEARHVWEDRIATIQKNGLDAIAKIIENRWFSENFCKENPEKVAEIKEMLRKVDPDAYIGCCAAIRDMNLNLLHSKIQNPVLILAGSRDSATPPDHSRVILQNIFLAKYAELNGAHLLNLEKEDEFNRVVFEFLQL